MFLGLFEQDLEMISCFTYENTMTFEKVIQVIGHYSNQISAAPQVCRLGCEARYTIFAIHSQSFCHSELQSPQIT